VELLTDSFFEFRGEGSREATESCGICRYNKCCHDPAYFDRLVASNTYERWVSRLPMGEHEFEPAGPAKFDSWYCGHAGWD
jgi:hypothetical protein